jgi:hypothetical protein
MFKESLYRDMKISLETWRCKDFLEINNTKFIEMFKEKGTKTIWRNNIAFSLKSSEYFLMKMEIQSMETI